MYNYSDIYIYVNSNGVFSHFLKECLANAAFVHVIPLNYFSVTHPHSSEKEYIMALYKCVPNLLYKRPEFNTAHTHDYYY